MAGRGFVQQDVVEVIVKKLPAAMQKDISRHVIVKTQEHLRLLLHKAPQQLIKKFDTKELRAACMLEYVCRKAAGIRLDQEIIAKSLGVKNNTNFGKLHRLIGNYLEEPKLPTATRSNPKRNSSQPTQRSQVEQKESIIPRLSIRLNSLIHDPNGFALKAQTLFDDLITYVDGLKGPRKTGHQTDIQRFRAAYEAACLYHVVAKTQTKKLSRMSKKQGNSQQTNSTGQDDDPNRTLEISDIIDASPEFTVTDFKEVVKYVEILIIEMEESKAKNASKKTKTTKRTVASKAESKKRSTKHTTHKGKKKRPPADSKAADDIFNKKAKSSHGVEPTEDVAAQDSSDDDDDDDDDRLAAEKILDGDIPSLHEWRRQTLDKACQAARNEFEKTDTPPDQITRTMLLKSAADAVLGRFGLIA